MKKAIALILSLMLVLGMSAALAETAAAPQVIPAESVKDFVGEWEICGVNYGENYFTIAQWTLLQGQSQQVQMDLTITETTLTLISSGQRAVAPVSMNADGTLAVSDNSSGGYIQLRDDGSLVFIFSSNEGSNYSVVFTRK